MSLFKDNDLILNVLSLWLFMIQLLYSEHTKCHGSVAYKAEGPMTIIIITDRATFIDYSFLSLIFGGWPP